VAIRKKQFLRPLGEACSQKWNLVPNFGAGCSLKNKRYPPNSILNDIEYVQYLVIIFIANSKMPMLDRSVFRMGCVMHNSIQRRSFIFFRITTFFHVNLAFWFPEKGKPLTDVEKLIHPYHLGHCERTLPRLT